MFGRPAHAGISVTDKVDRIVLILTILLAVVVSMKSYIARADETSLTGYSKDNSTLDSYEKDQRRTALIDFARQQAMTITPSLSDDLRSPARWLLNGIHATHSLLNVDVSTLSQVEDASEPSANPVTDMLHDNAPTLADEPSWLASTNYHHLRGISPARDALIAGMHMKHSVMDQYMQFDLHPYYGQNYFTTRRYYGTEAKLDLQNPTDTSSTSRPWGSISIGYVNGNNDLTEHGRGIDMHGTVNFTEHWSLNSGYRPHDTSENINYTLLQWKMPLQ
jgi:hypothetical protein